MRETKWPTAYRLRDADDIPVLSGAPFMIINTVGGCQAVSEGCANCFAVRYRRTDRFFNLEALHALREPEPKRVYVGTHADLFQPGIERHVDRVFDACRAHQQHKYYFLTRHVEGMRLALQRQTSIPDNWAFGVSVESAEHLDRIDVIRDFDVAEKYVSFAPILGRMDPHLSGIRWVICAGEFGGAKARGCELDWFRSIRQACHMSGTHFVIKTLGSKLGGGQILDGVHHKEEPPSTTAQEVGGQELNGAVYAE